MGPGRAPWFPVRDYTPFASGIWVFGHLADRLAQGGTAVHLAQPQEVIETLSEWWVVTVLTMTSRRTMSPARSIRGSRPNFTSVVPG